LWVKQEARSFMKGDSINYQIKHFYCTINPGLFKNNLHCY
jgi:hypothetical protein